MKKLAVVALALTLVLNVNAQKVKGKSNHKDGTQLDLKKDFRVDGKGVAKKAKSVALVKVAVQFKSITKESVSIGKGQHVTSSHAYAILDGVSDATRQEIVNEFSASFSKKLETLGLSIKEWNTVTSSEKWIKVTDKQIKKTYQNKNEGLFEVFTANNGPHTKQVVGNPGIWGAYAKVGKDIEAKPITIDVIVDFASFNIDMKKSSKTSRAGNTETTTTTTSANANVTPLISIQSFNGATGFGMMTSNLTMVGKYGEACIITLRKDIIFNGDYAKSLDPYSGKIPVGMKKKIQFGSNIDTGTYIITADEQKYKEAVLKALDVYSDYLITKLKEIRG